MGIILAMTIGFIIDLILGDPYFMPHPIKLMGNFIKTFEKNLLGNKKTSNFMLFIYGTILSLSLIFLSFIIPLIILKYLAYLNFYLKVMVESIFCYQILATKSLKTESMKVFYQLEKKEIQTARQYLSWIVGRDTANLGETEIIKATVETIAENTSDAVIAPLIFICIGGAPLGFLYKAVNTLDSMIGYKNDKYFYFGKFSAKIDDAVNYIPAILSAYGMLLSSYLLGLDTKNSYKIYRRDKKNHTSPNSAKTESVCAGALNVQLGGDNYYFRKLVHKKTIGDDNRRINAEDIKTANNLMTTSAIVSVISLVCVKLILLLL